MKFFDLKGVRNCLIYSLFDHFKLGRSLVTGVLIGRRGQARARWNTLQWGQSPVASLAFGLGPLLLFSFLFFSFHLELHSLLFTRLLHRVLQGACLLGGYMALYIYIACSFLWLRPLYSSELSFAVHLLLLGRTVHMEWNSDCLSTEVPRSPWTCCAFHCFRGPLQDYMLQTCFFLPYIHAWGQKKGGASIVFVRTCSAKRIFHLLDRMQLFHLLVLPWCHIRMHGRTVISE